MPGKKDTFKQMGLIPHITVKLRRQNMEPMNQFE